MNFSTIFSITLALVPTVFSAPVENVAIAKRQSLSAAEMVANINKITSMSAALDTSATIAKRQSISAAKTVSNINQLTSMSSALDKTAKSVTLLNGFQTGPVCLFLCAFIYVVQLKLIDTVYMCRRLFKDFIV